jgi:hypothetical protein
MDPDPAAGSPVGSSSSYLTSILDATIHAGFLYSPLTWGQHWVTGREVIGTETEENPAIRTRKRDLIGKAYSSLLPNFASLIQAQRQGKVKETPRGPGDITD